MITVYTKPPEMGHCQMCVATTRKLDKLGLEYTEKNLYAPENEGILQYALDQGVQSAPVVDVQLTHERITFGGYRPDLLLELADGLADL